MAASIAAEENEGFTINASSSSGADIPNDEVFDEDDDEDEEMILVSVFHNNPSILYDFISLRCFFILLHTLFFFLTARDAWES